MTSRLQHRIDADLKKEAEAILEAQGFKPSQAITLFYTEIKRNGGFPFIPSKVPNSELREDLVEAKKKIGLESYKNKKHFFDELNKL